MRGIGWLIMGGATVVYIISQVICFIGTFAILIGMQQRKYDRVVMCKITNEFTAAVHYLLLGGYTGMAINLASILANSVYWYRIKHNKSNRIFQIIFGIGFAAVGVLSWQGFISIFIIVSKCLSSASLGIKNTRIIRLINLITNPCWLIYNIYMGSIVGIVTDTLVTASVVIAVIRLDILRIGEKKEALPVTK